MLSIFQKTTDIEVLLQPKGIKTGDAKMFAYCNCNKSKQYENATNLFTPRWKNCLSLVTALRS